ncbi:MAG: hypothetical protein CL940_00810 [Deltaproteobacteria bacterium]|nr:hypothetical protein [Deltaproteobacteria bacterium]
MHPTLLLIAALLTSQTPTDAPAAPAALPEERSASALDQLIDGVEERTSRISNYEAKFHQEVTRKHLPRPLKRSGTVYFKKPGMMRWDYQIPERVYYISDGQVLWSYEAREKLAYKLPVKNSELYSALKFLFGQGKLREEFSIRQVAATKGLLGLELTPKVPQSGYTKLVLEVSSETYDIRSTILFDPIGNESRVRFENAKTDKVLKEAAFRFTPPDGVRVEDLTRSETAKEEKP